jgi:transposase
MAAGLAGGQANNPEFVERQMYGRANFDRRRRRVLLIA